MIDETYRELMDREIDGDTSPEESAELGRLLAERPELAATFDRMRAVAHALDSMQEVPPPAGLKERILAATRPMEARAVERDPSPSLREWFALVFAPSRLRFAAVVAGGIAVGFVGAVLALDGRLAPSTPADHAVGTLAGPASGGHEVVARAEADLGDRIARLVLTAADSEFVLTVDVPGGDSFRLELDQDAEILVPRGYRGDVGGSTAHAAMSAREVVLDAQTGGSFRVEYERVAPAPARIGYRFVTGRGVVEGALPIDQL